MADIISELGVLFVSKLDPKFGDNVNAAVKQFEEQIKPMIQHISALFRGLGKDISAFYKMVEAVPVINIAKSIDTTGISEKLVGTFKDARKKAVEEFKGMSSDIQKELTKLQREFGKYSEIIDKLRAGEDPVVHWGEPKFNKGGMSYPKAMVATGWTLDETHREQYQQRSEQEFAISSSIARTGYEEKRLAVYQRMVELVGQLGAFERARIASGELIAKVAQEELNAKTKIAEVVKIIDTFRGRGLLVREDEQYISSIKKHLEDVWRNKKDIGLLDQAIEDVMKRIVKDEQAVKDIILSSIGDKEKILAITKQIADQYEKIKSSSIGAMGGGAGGIGGGGGDWDMLIGKIQLAGAVVSQFQQKLQTIQLKSFLNPDEFIRLSSIAQAINSEITDLTNKIARLGSQSVAREMARDWDKLRADVEETGKAFKEAGALQAKGLPVANVVDLDKAVYGLTTRLKELAQRGEATQLQALRAGLAKTNAEIQQLTGGAEINRKSLKQLGLNTLELEKLQGLLINRMKLIREEFSLTGKATAQMNVAMKSTGESLGVVQYQVGQFTKRSADASRAMDRWGAGFVDMLKSQMAWLLGGALIFGTVFKIQQAFSEAIGTIFKFRQAIIDVGAITNASADDMKILEKAARDVATSTKMGFIEAADALKILGQAGLTAKESAEALRTVAMLVTATGASSQEAVKVLTTAMNVWKLSAQESTRVGNVLAAALNYSKLEINDLATSFNYVAATAKQVGMSIEQTAATLAVLSNAGLRASTIGTGLRGILGQLIAPSANFRKELGAIGVKFEDIRMPGNNLIDILGLLEKKGFDLTSIFEGLEKRQAGVFASLRDMGPAALQRMTDALTGTNAMLVMNERAMQGPMNQLHVFKTRLLDVALSISDIVVPSFNALLKGLGGLVETFKMLWPVFIGAGVFAGIRFLTRDIGLLGESVTKLGLAMSWLYAHPIIAGLALIAVAVTAVKLTYDALKKSNEDYIKQIDRQVMIYVQQVGELEALKIRLQSVKMSEEEIKDAVNNLSGEYTGLKEIINKVGFTHSEVTNQVIKDIDEWYKAIDSLKLDRLKLILEDLETIHKKIDDARAKYRALQEQKSENLMTEAGGFVVNPATKSQLLDANQAISDLMIIEGKLKQSAMDTGRAYKDKTEEVLRGMLKEKKFSEEYIRTSLDARRQAIQDEKNMQQKALEDNMKARLSTMQTGLFEMRKALATEEGKVRLEYKEGMGKYPKEGYSDTEAGVKAARLAAEGRAAVQAVYDRKMGELRAKELKRKSDFELELRGEALSDQLSLAKHGADEEVKINRVKYLEIQQELLQFEKKSAEIQYDKAIGKLTPTESAQRMISAYNAYGNAVIAKEEEATLAIQKMKGKAQEKAKKDTKDFNNQMLRLKREEAEAMIATAKTVGVDVAAQEEIYRQKGIVEQEEYVNELNGIFTKHSKDEYLLTVDGLLLVWQAQKTHSEKVIALEQQKNKAMADTAKKWEKEELDRKEKALMIEVEASTRADQIILKNKQAQYDSLSEIYRTSEFGKKLKYEIDEKTKSISDSTIKTYEDTLALLKSGEQTEATTLLMVKLREEMDRLAEKSRTASRAIADYLGSRTLWQGLEAGVMQFGQSLEDSFTFGKNLAIEFGKTVQQAIADPLNDLFTNKFKSWSQYMKSFFNSMGLMFSKMIQQMIWEFTGFKKATETGGSVGDMFGGLVGIVGKALGLVGSVAGPEQLGIGYSSAPYHRGGTIKKMHEGGLQKDEVIAKLLTNEYVLKRESARSIGRENLDYMNREGRMPRDKPVIVPAPEVKIVNLLDARAIVAKALYDQPNLIINPITANAGLVRRILGT